MEYEFIESDNGRVADRWPCFEEDRLPSIRLAMRDKVSEIGYAVIIPSRKSLANIYVYPEFRGGLMGTMLLDECIRRYDVRALYAFPADSNGKDLDQLVSWYGSRGFELTGISMIRH